MATVGHHDHRMRPYEKPPADEPQKTIACVIFARGNPLRCSQESPKRCTMHVADASQIPTTCRPMNKMKPASPSNLAFEGGREEKRPVVQACPRSPEARDGSEARDGQLGVSDAPDALEKEGAATLFI